MANTTTVSNNSTNLNNFSPTGVLNIVSGVRDQSFVACGANQQINVGDPVFNNNDATFGNVGLPASSLSGNNFTSGVSNAAANALAISTMQLYLHNNFVGFAAGYRSAKATSYGKNQDRIPVACGRIKMLVDPSDANYANATPAGTFWSQAFTCTNPVANNANVTCKTGYAASVATANLSLGRQAFPKAANEPYVYFDAISSLIAGGVQPIDTAS